MAAAATSTRVPVTRAAAAEDPLCRSAIARRLCMSGIASAHWFLDEHIDGRATRWETDTANPSTRTPTYMCIGSASTVVQTRLCAHLALTVPDCGALLLPALDGPASPSTRLREPSNRVAATTSTADRDVRPGAGSASRRWREGGCGASATLAFTNV